MKPGSKVSKLYGQEIISERHRHRYEVNNKFRAELEKAGMIFSGLSPDERLVEIIELADHPSFVACQFHPELKSRPDHAHPLFLGFVEAVAKRSGHTVDVQNEQSVVPPNQPPIHQHP